MRKWIDYPENSLGSGSTADSLVGLAINIEEAFNVGKSLLAAFLDVEAVSNNLVPCTLLQILADTSISGNILRYVRFSTALRRVYNETLGKGCRILCKGIPLGGVLSPLLFIMYIKDIGKGILKSATLFNFADDSAIFR